MVTSRISAVVSIRLGICDPPSSEEVLTPMGETTVFTRASALARPVTVNNKREGLTLESELRLHYSHGVLFKVRLSGQFVSFPRSTFLSSQLVRLFAIAGSHNRHSSTCYRM